MNFRSICFGSHRKSHHVVWDFLEVHTELDEKILEQQFLTHKVLLSRSISLELLPVQGLYTLMTVHLLS